MMLALILGFAALLLLLLLALLWSRWPAYLKLILVVGVTALYFYGHDAVHAIWGAPSTDRLPERFVMISAVVEEPTQRNPGAIYVWVSPIDEDRQSTLDPRAYRLAYSRPLHSQIDDGLKRGRDGVSQMGTASDVKRSGKGKGKGWLQPGEDEQEIRIRDMPVPQLPEK